MSSFVKQQTPHGGWVYNEGDTILKEDTFDKLVLTLVAHRINNGKTMGSPAKDIEKQITERIKNVNISRKN